MVKKEKIEQWLNKAEEDFLYAVMSLEDNLPFFSQICFHFQQAAEKYLKTYIVAYELKFTKIHDLLELLKICAEKDKDFLILNEDCNFLNRYYIDTRYPVHWPTQHTKETTGQAKEAADRIAKFIKDKLPI